MQFFKIVVRLSTLDAVIILMQSIYFKLNFLSPCLTRILLNAEPKIRYLEGHCPIFNTQPIKSRDFEGNNNLWVRWFQINNCGRQQLLETESGFNKKQELENSLC